MGLGPFAYVWLVGPFHSSTFFLALSRGFWCRRFGKDPVTEIKAFTYMVEPFLSGSRREPRGTGLGHGVPFRARALDQWERNVGPRTTTNPKMITGHQPPQRPTRLIRRVRPRTVMIHRCGQPWGPTRLCKGGGPRERHRRLVGSYSEALREQVSDASWQAYLCEIHRCPSKTTK